MIKTNFLDDTYTLEIKINMDLSLYEDLFKKSRELGFDSIEDMYNHALNRYLSSMNDND